MFSCLDNIWSLLLGFISIGIYSFCYTTLCSGLLGNWKDTHTQKSVLLAKAVFYIKHWTNKVKIELFPTHVRDSAVWNSTDLVLDYGYFIVHIMFTSIPSHHRICELMVEEHSPVCASGQKASVTADSSSYLAISFHRPLLHSHLKLS